MRTHVAYCLITGEILTTNRSNYLKRWVARHSANDHEWFAAQGLPDEGHRWVFAHGKDFDDCVAKLTARKKFGTPAEEEPLEYVGDPDYPMDDDEDMGFNPYMGCYDWDC